MAPEADVLRIHFTTDDVARVRVAAEPEVVWALLTDAENPDQGFTIVTTAAPVTMPADEGTAPQAPAPSATVAPFRAWRGSSCGSRSTVRRWRV